MEQLSSRPFLDNVNIFSQHPFVRILFPFLAGVLLEIFFDLPDLIIGIISGILFSIYLIDFFFLHHFGKYQWRFANGIFLNILILSIGIFWTSFFDESKNTEHYSHLPEGKTILRVEIIRDPIIKEKSVKAEIRILEVKKKEWEYCSGTAFLYLKKDENSMKLEYGDELILNSSLTDIKGPQNPEEFDYKTYCKNKRIFASIYANRQQWIKSGEGGNFILHLASDLRKSFQQILKDSGLDGQEYAVASALILGSTDDIDDETKNAYAVSGALHVLSVSGLHVAIIFVVLDKLLSFLMLFKRGKHYKAFLILGFLWIYALMTGLSPSVIRSAAMLSFVVVGKLINRNASIYNILCASAFVLIAYDPYLVLDVGFQLSYLAVFGIVYLHPKIYNLIFFKRKIPDFIWNVTAVSIAAQLITFPLGLFYFHQFPNYFLLANLAVIPLGTIILYNGVAALLFSFVPGLNELLIFTLKWSVWLLNESVKFVENLPYASTKGIFISVVELVLIYFLLFFILRFLENRRARNLQMALVTSIVLVVGFSIGKWENLQRQEFIIYQIRGETAMAFHEGNQAYFFSKKSLTEDERKMNFHILNHRYKNGIEDSKIIFLDGKAEENGRIFKLGKYLAIGETNLFIADSTFKKRKVNEKLKVDMIIVSGNPKLKIQDLDSMYDYKTLVIDGSNSFYLVEKWKKYLNPKKENVLLGETGSYRIEY